MDWTGVPFKNLPDLEDTTSKAFRWQRNLPAIYDDRPSSLGVYAGLFAPDFLQTEEHQHAGSRDINPAIQFAGEKAGTLGRAAYFAALTYALSKLDDKLQKKNPKLSSVLRAVVGGGQKQMIQDNLVGKQLRDQGWSYK